MNFAGSTLLPPEARILLKAFVTLDTATRQSWMCSALHDAKVTQPPVQLRANLHDTLRLKRPAKWPLAVATAAASSSN